MGRPGINYSNVAKAAAEIIAQGQVPTIERLRTKLETGSYSTLGALLKEWKAKQALQQQYATNSQLPDELITAVQKVWEVINEKTNDQLIKIREEAENDRQTYQQKINHEKELITAAEIAFRELNEKYRILSNEKSALEQALQEQHIQQAALLATQNNFEIQLSEKQARIDELLRLNQQVQNNLEHYRQASHEQRLLEQQQYETRHNELEQRNHKLQENWTSILTENTKIKSEFEQLFLVHEKLHNDQLKIGNEQIEKSKNLLETQQFLAEKTHLS